jgi:dsDNA-binding SOS-regulon protein
MISIRSSVKLKGSVLDIEETKDFIVATDNTYYIYFIDKETFSIKKSLNVTAKPKPLHSYSKASNVSTKGIFNVAAKDKKSSILLTTAKEIKKRKIIDNHHKDIEVTTFTTNSFVMATGGADGCVFFHDMRYMKTLGSMKIKPDFISTLNFSQDNSLLLSAGYDKSVTIFDMDRNKVLNELTFPDVIEDAKFYDQNKKLFLISRNGSSIIYDLKEEKIISTSNHFSHWPTRAILTDDEEYAIVGSRSNHLYIVRLEDNKKRLNIQLKTDGIVSLKLFKKSQFILIGYADGTLDIIDFNILEEELEAKLKVKDYRAVKELFDKNVFLRTHPLAKKFDEAWPEVLQKIIQLITAEKIDKALFLAEPFLDDEKREEEFNFYMAQQKHVLKLNELVKEKEYVKAFQLVAKFPYLEKLKIYKQLEAYWQKVLAKARALLEENPVFNKAKAEELLKPFMRVESKKEIATMMLQHVNVFGEADKCVKEKRFYNYFSLVKKHQFLKETELYEKVDSLAQRLLQQATQLEQAGEFKDVFTILESLKQFTPYIDKVKALTTSIKFKNDFIKAVTEDNKTVAYKILSQYDDAKLLPEYGKLARELNQKIEEAKKPAYAGKPKETLSVLDDYLVVPYTMPKAASIVKIAYINEIELNSAREHSINWKSTIDKYMSLFGKDGDLIYICRKIATANKILEDIEAGGNSEGYMNVDFPMSIIVDN